MPTPPTHPQGEPGRFADPHYSRSPRRRCRCRRSTSTPRTCSRSASRRSAASRRCRCSARRSTRCASSSIRTRSPRAASASTRCEQAVVQQQRQPADRHAVRARHGDFTVQATGQLMNAAAFAPMIVTYRNGAPVRLDEIGRVIDSVQNDKIAAWFNGNARHRARGPAPAGNQHDRGGRRDQKSCCRPSRRSCRRRSTSTSSTTARSRSARRCTTCSSAAADARAGGAGDLPFPAQRFGDDHPQPGAADVDHRHVRGDVRCSTTASTTSR